MSKITEDDVFAALDLLVEIEPEPNAVQSLGEYHALMAEYKTRTDPAEAVLRRFAEQIRPLALDHMQDVFYRFTSDPRYVGYHRATVVGLMRRAFDSTGPWRN